MVQRIPLEHRLPSAMAVCAAGSGAIAYDFGRCVGSLSRASGIDTTLGPVLDPASPSSALGTRSFSDDVGRIGRTAEAVVRGINDAGGRCVIKHFPGYAFGNGDPEISSTLDSRPAAAVRRSLRPFALIRGDSVGAVMTAHTVVRALDARRPGTLSPVVIDELRLIVPRALIISDALDMPALTSRYPAATIPALALNAGVDCLLYSHETAAFAAAHDLADAIVRGAIASRRFADASQAVSRFARAAHRTPALSEDVGAMQRRVAAASVTAINGPPRGARSGVTLVLATARDTGLAEMVARPLSQYVDVRLRTLLDDRTPYDVSRLHLLLLNSPEDAPALDRLFRAAHVPRLAVVCLGNPFAATFLRDRPVYFTYGAEFEQLNALAEIIVGRAEPQGRLPVRLAPMSL